MWVIAGSTVTQLVRMKVFYFLIPIALLFIGLQFVDGFWFNGPDMLLPEQELRAHKSWCLGTMMVFSSLFAIVATALLIPGDVEDRTLYSILCKPVPRLDYLVGKLLGVVVVIGVAVLVMDLLLVLTLHFRAEAKLAEMIELMKVMKVGPEEAEVVKRELAEHGSTWNLQAGVLAHFLRACVIAAVALLISTFSNSTIFTIATSVMVWVIGSFQSIARDGIFRSQEMGEELTWADRVLGTLISVVFPDFQLYEAVADGAARAQEIVMGDVGKLLGLTGLYVGIYVVISWFVFSDKEL